MTEKRRCRTCMKEKSLTGKYWRRWKKAPGGFLLHCKDCTKKAIQVHYVKWYAVDLKTRGPVGVKCPLWAPSCEHCEDVTECWRLEEDPEDEDDIPVPLRY